MPSITTLTGWKRVTPALDVEVWHDIPVHVYSTVSVHDGAKVMKNESVRLIDAGVSPLVEAE